MAEQSIPYASALSAEQVERVRQLVEQGLNLDDRWAAYGAAYGLGAAGGDPVDRVKQAVRSRLAELQKLICNDHAIGKIAAAPQTGVALALAFMVTGKLVQAHFQDVDVIQLGVLIAQAGLMAVCQGQL